MDAKFVFSEIARAKFEYRNTRSGANRSHSGLRERAIRFIVRSLFGRDDRAFLGGVDARRLT